MGAADSPQDELLDFMGRPAAYSPSPATVERIDTHASSVFLAGHFAYKVKRAVKYPFLDFPRWRNAASPASTSFASTHVPLLSSTLKSSR